MGLKTLYQKIFNFESLQSERSKSLSQCRAGCSRCCYVDLTIFDVEANHLREWFQTLGQDQQILLVQSWSEPKAGACAFLVDEKCSVYEARPTICRTQGLALSFQTEQQKMVDICPLNEKVLDSISPAEVLNLEVLNRILSGLETEHSQGLQKPRVSLTNLRSEFIHRAKSSQK